MGTKSCAQSISPIPRVPEDSVFAQTPVPFPAGDKVEINSFCPLVLPAIAGIYLSGVIFVFRINDYTVGGLGPMGTILRK